ncbi:hypothetical protein RUM43_004348 [Polyplax serrata]|uniref:Uncharacterized protein n=1 Tax=Polyplax serrata TaxID=468196 RepID=A0AAN8SB16_POLSC
MWFNSPLVSNLRGGRWKDEETRAPGEGAEVVQEEVEEEEEIEGGDVEEKITNFENKFVEKHHLACQNINNIAI